MVLQLPRLTNSLRKPFDIDAAYLHRKYLLLNLNRQSQAKSLDESELARKIVYDWEQVVELIGGEVVSEELHEVALAAYRLFSDIGEEGADRRRIGERNNPIIWQAFHVPYQTDNNVLLGAPTGSGKTISAELAMFRLFNTQPDMQVICIAPLKALVRERMSDWRKRLVTRLGKEMVEMTGDYTPDMMALLSAGIIISTPEKWDGISRNWQTRSYVKKVGLMILDESHLLGADRGPILETERSVRFVGLSTALANPGDLADWLGVRETGLYNFKPSVRPVPLEVHIQYATSDEHPRKFLNLSEEELQMMLYQITDQNLRHTLQFGCGLHHAGLNDKDRSAVEELFGNNKIQGTEYFDGKMKRYVDFPITDIFQMMGRAGRPQYDQHGKTVILVHEPKKSFYKKFFYEPFPVESILREKLHDPFTAEFVSGTICHKADAIHYLVWTYFYRRLMFNPAYDGLEGTDPGILSSLVQSTFENLEDSGCIKMNDDGVESMMLGSIASQYYLNYLTVSMFGSNLGPNLSLEVLLRVLSAASEYDELLVHHNEENHNALLAQSVPYKVDNDRLDDPHAKANLLFQAHFSQVEMPISDYVTDLKSVLDQSIRIIHAMIDVCANSGWLSSTLTCMHLMQMVMQGLWFDKNASLKMVPCLSQDVIGMLVKGGIANLQQLLGLSRARLQNLLGNFPASTLYQDLLRFPRIQMKLRLQQNKQGNGSRYSLNIRLENIHKRKTKRALTPHFPKVKEEAWWLVLGDSTSSELFALKRVSFKDHLVTHMNLPPTAAVSQGLKLFLVSDCYLGYGLEHSLEELLGTGHQ